MNGASNPYFMSQVQQGPTLHPGWAVSPAQALDLTGLPGMGGLPGMAVQMLLSNQLFKGAAAHGMLPMQFMPTQGAYDHMMARQLLQDRSRAVQLAAQYDRAAYETAFKRMAYMSGTPFGDAQRAAASRMAGDVAGMMPVLGMFMPELIDSMHGSKGSAAVMAQYMANAARYQRDPLTGLTGMTGDTSGRLAGAVFSQLYDGEGHMTRTRGLSAGRMGQLHDELTRRGLMGRGVSEGELAAMRRGAEAEADKWADPALPAFERTGPFSPEAAVAKKFTATESERVAARLKEMAGTVSAMRDIFGDMGRRDAPMSELINGLQMLTQGGLATMDAGSLERLVRRTHLLAKNSGMSMDAFVQLAGAGAGQADQLGLNRQFAVLATQGAAAYGHGHAASGMGATPLFGAMDRDRVTALDMQLNLSAAGSQQAGVLNAVMTLYDSGRLKKGTRMHALAERVKRRENVGVVTPADYHAMAAEAGVSTHESMQMLLNRETTQEAGVRYDTGGMVRRMQAEDLVATIGDLEGAQAVGAMSADAQGRLSGEQRRRLGRSMMSVFLDADSKTGVSLKDRADPAKRDLAMARAVYRGLSDADKRALGDTEAEALENLRAMSADFRGGLDRATASGGRLSVYGSGTGVFQMHNKQSREEADRFRAEQAVNAELQGALAPFNQLGPLQRVADIFMTDIGEKEETVGAAVTAALGGVKNTELAKALRGNMTQIGNVVRDFRSGKLSPEQVREQLDRLMPTIKEDLAKQNFTLDLTALGGPQFDAAAAGYKKFNAADGTTTSRAQGAAELIQQSGSLLAAVADDEEARRVVGPEGMKEARGMSARLKRIHKLRDGKTLENVIDDPKLRQELEELDKEMRAYQKKYAGRKPGDTADKGADKTAEQIRGELREMSADNKPLTSGAVTTVRFDSMPVVSVKELAERPKGAAAGSARADGVASDRGEVVAKLENVQIEIIGPRTGKMNAQLRVRNGVPAPDRAAVMSG